MKFLKLIPAAVLAVLAVPAAAQEEPPKPVTISGSVAIVSDYRLRGISQSDEAPAIQGGITASHESGVYAGVWMSSLAGWGTFAGCNCELDLVAGYKADLGGAAIDLGVTTYLYPAGLPKTTFFEPFIKVSGTAGPASLLLGIAYAPKQEALGRWSNDAANAQAVAEGLANYDHPGAKDDNLYIWGDVAAGIPNSPVTVKAHLGYSDGNPGLGPNGTSVAPTGKYVDWLLGVDIALPETPLTIGLAYVDTNISDREAAYLQPNFSNTRNGDSIADGRFVLSLTAAF